MNTSIRSLAVAAVAVFIFASGVFATTTASRPAPFPTYAVGDLARLTITTNPVQANAPVYQFRFKNGQPDGAQPTLIGYTNASGVLYISGIVQETWIGSYTGERFAVGSPFAPATASVNFDVVAAPPARPSVSRAAPFPSYQVGDTATLTIDTNPSQPYAPIYQFRNKDGQPDGIQPTLVGYTDGFGDYSLTATVEASWVGNYTEERFAVGSPSGPTSAPKSFTISNPITGSGADYFIMTDCTGCSTTAKRATAEYLAGLNQRGGLYMVVLYDDSGSGENRFSSGNHLQFDIDVEFDRERNQWISTVLRSVPPVADLIEAIELAVDLFRQYNDRLDSISVEGTLPDNQGQLVVDLDSLYGLGTTPQQREVPIDRMDQMSSVFLKDVSRRLLAIGQPEQWQLAIEQVGRKIGEAATTDNDDTFGYALDLNLGVKSGGSSSSRRPKLDIKTGLKIDGSHGSSNRTANSLIEDLKVHSAFRLRIEFLEMDNSITGMNLIWSYQRQRWLLEEAIGPGGSRLPFDENGNLDRDLIDNPIIFPVFTYNWWWAFDQLLFGGTLLPKADCSIDHVCRIYIE